MNNVEQIKQKTQILGYKNKVPIFSSFRISWAVVAFYCPFCKKIHRHGWADGHPNGYRAAHCDNPESLLHETDYYLVCVADLRKGEALE